jgi:Tol biopolymer transport system component
VGRYFSNGRLSPDGTRIALQISGANEELWLYDTRTSTLSRLTFEGENTVPVWTPDGQRLIFTSNRSGAFYLYWMAPDGSGIQQLTSTPVIFGQPVSISPDGKTIAFVHYESKGAPDIWIMPLDGDRRARPLASTTFTELAPQISPDGRRIAYSSNESGQFEVYVQAFPQAAVKRQVSVNGGLRPMWGRNGRELFYIQGDTLMVADVGLGESFSAGKPRVLFPADKFVTWYEPVPDGRFLMIQRSEEETSTRQVEVVLNFFEELKARVSRTR